jgi:hypothetical protein
MSKLIAYEKDYGDYGWALSEVNLTGRCKKVTIRTVGKDEPNVYEYMQHRVTLFGIPLWTRWINKENIVWREETIEEYECGDMKNG